MKHSFEVIQSSPARSSPNICRLKAEMGQDEGIDSCISHKDRADRRHKTRAVRRGSAWLQWRLLPDRSIPDYLETCPGLCVVASHGPAVPRAGLHGLATVQLPGDETGRSSYISIQCCFGARGSRPPSLTATPGCSTSLTVERANVSLRVASLERTLVDVLNRPRLSGGWEEVWRSLESVEFFDLDRMVEYALLLSNATTVARVGFFLEQHRDVLMVNEAHLARLRHHRPRRPHYLDRARRGGRLVTEWNLVVPTDVMERSWAEVA